MSKNLLLLFEALDKTLSFWRDENSKFAVIHLQ